MLVYCLRSVVTYCDSTLQVSGKALAGGCSCDNSNSQATSALPLTNHCRPINPHLRETRN